MSDNIVTTHPLGLSLEQAASFHNWRPDWADVDEAGFRGEDGAPQVAWSTTLVEREGLWIGLSRVDVWIDGAVEIGELELWQSVDGGNAVELTAPA